MGSVNTSLFVINTLSGVLGILGNGLVSLVIIFERSMHTNTNALILHQATIDFLGSVFILAHAYLPKVDPIPQGIAGVLSCVLWNSRYFLFTLFVASTYSLIAITFERYFAIVHPYRYGRLFHGKKPIGLILSGLWILVLTFRLYVVFQWSVSDGSCVGKPNGHGLAVIIFMFQYIIPLALMSYMYFGIAVAISKSARRIVPTVSDQDNRNGGGESLLRARRNTFKALLIVFVTFVLCWSLNQVLFFLHNMDWRKLSFDTTTYIISVALVSMNSCINPFIYAIKYKKFKQAMRRLFYRAAGREDRLNLTDEYPGTDQGSNQ